MQYADGRHSRPRSLPTRKTLRGRSRPPKHCGAVESASTRSCGCDARRSPPAKGRTRSAPRRSRGTRRSSATGSALTRSPAKRSARATRRKAVEACARSKPLTRCSATSRLTRGSAGIDDQPLSASDVEVVSSSDFEKRGVPVLPSPRELARPLPAGRCGLAGRAPTLCGLGHDRVSSHARRTWRSSKSRRRERLSDRRGDSGGLVRAFSRPRGAVRGRSARGNARTRGPRPKKPGASAVPALPGPPRDARVRRRIEIVTSAKRNAGCSSCHARRRSPRRLSLAPRRRPGFPPPKGRARRLRPPPTSRTPRPTGRSNQPSIASRRPTRGPIRRPLGSRRTIRGCGPRGSTLSAAPPRLRLERPAPALRPAPAAPPRSGASPRRSKDEGSPARAACAPSGSFLEREKRPPRPPAPAGAATGAELARLVRSAPHPASGHRGQAPPRPPKGALASLRRWTLPSRARRLRLVSPLGPPRAKSRSARDGGVRPPDGASASGVDAPRRAPVGATARHGPTGADRASPPPPSPPPPPPQVATTPRERSPRPCPRRDDDRRRLPLPSPRARRSLRLLRAHRRPLRCPRSRRDLPLLRARRRPLRCPRLRRDLPLPERVRRPISARPGRDETPGVRFARAAASARPRSASLRAGARR